MSGSSARAQARHIFAILLLGGTIWVLLLRFFFPGYFDPFVPFHVDHFVYLGDSSEGYGLWRYLYFYPRPLGNALFDLIGRLGTRGMLLPVFLLTLVNAVLLIRYVERVTGRSVSLFTIALFFVLCLANPESYSSVKEDILAVVCLFGVLVIFHLWQNYLETARWPNLAAIVVLAFLSSYVKETYFAVLVLFFLFHLLTNTKHRIAALVMLLAMVVIAIASLVFNARRGPFVKTRALPTDPYYQDWSLASIFHGYVHLLSFLVFPAVALLVLAALVFLARKSRLAFTYSIASLLFIGAVLLPHSLLPNHLEDQYAWLGAFFLFTPLLFADVFIGRRRLSLIFAVVLITALGLYQYQRSIPKGMAGWLREQEQLQRTFLSSWPILKAAGATGGHDLVIAPTIPYQPFSVPGYVVKSFGAERRWTVVLPDATQKKKKLTTEVIHAADLTSLDYDHIFVFSPDARLVGLYSKEDARAMLKGGGFQALPSLPSIAVE
jgi:hypothetical protein